MRTIGVIVAGCVLLCIAVLVSLVLWLGAIAGMVVALTLAAVIVATYVVAIGPWQRRWGATRRELDEHLPGDDRLPATAASTTRAIEIDAQPSDVFPWLRQIGLGRGGWYSYDWIDNDGRASIDRIDPSLWLEVGDRVEMLPGMGPTVREIVSNHHLLSAGERDSWCLLVEPTADGRTRLVSRWRQVWPSTLATHLWIAIVDPGAFIMERKMLRTIRGLAERRARERRSRSRERHAAEGHPDDRGRRGADETSLRRPGALVSHGRG
jgi:hypothetical protein